MRPLLTAGLLAPQPEDSPAAALAAAAGPASEEQRAAAAQAVASGATLVQRTVARRGAPRPGRLACTACAV